MSQAWSRTSLGSQGWTVERLRELGGCAGKRAPFALGVPGPLCMGPHSPDPRRPSYRETKPRVPRGWWSIWAGRAFKSPLGSASPGAGVPSSSLLPLGRPTYRRRHPQQRSVAALGRHPGAGLRLRGKKSGDTTLGCFFWRIPRQLTSQEQDSP